MTDDCQQQISRLLASDSRLSPASSLLFLSLLVFIYFEQKAVVFFSPKINIHSVSYVRQYLEQFITRVKLIFKDNGI